MCEARAVASRVKVLPATRNRFTAMPIHSTRKRRVAAYARVSTDSEEQYTSYVAQVSYYTDYIKRNTEWEFVDVYTDEGITGTSTKKRDGFNRMIQDALDGKIDLIVTKSVSRFARNTVDSLTTIRKLKECGVEVYFEKENIYSLDSKGELLLTIMSSLAQEESRSISENVTWGRRKQFADGKVSMPYKHFLGYKRGADGEPEIVEEEAKIVRWIYQMFLEGKTPFGIAQILTEAGVPTPSGKSKWSPSTILRILINEKYKGDALLQKTFCTDFLTKKMKVNEGEVPQYYVENSHPAIVTAEQFDMVQRELAERKGKTHSGAYAFSGKIICGCCGNAYGSKVWHSTDKYRKVIWQCNAKFKNAEKCTTPHLVETEIQQAFTRVLNKMIAGKATVIDDTTQLMELLTNCRELQEEEFRLQQELGILEEIIRKLIAENAAAAMEQDDYNRRLEAHMERYKAAEARYAEVQKEIQYRQQLREKLMAFIQTLKTTEEPILDFSEDSWHALVDHVTVMENGDMVFTMKNGQKI